MEPHGRDPSQAQPAILNHDTVAGLCRLHHAAVFRYIAYRVRRRADAEDLAAEVFVRLLKAKPLSGDTQLGLLYRIAENLIIDYYRRRAVRNRLFDDEAGGESENTGKDAPDPATRVDVERGLRALAGEQYQVVILRFMHGHSVQETAAILNKTPGAVKALQYRALQQMRLELLDHETRR